MAWLSRTLLPHWPWVAGYLGLLSLLSFTLMGVDKARAQRKEWRIPERTLLLTALLGGAAGGWLGMRVFHHKTRHWYFRFGLPALFLLHLALLILLIRQAG